MGRKRKEAIWANFNAKEWEGAKVENGREEQ